MLNANKTTTKIATNLVKDALNRDYLWWSSKNIVVVVCYHVSERRESELPAIEHYFNDEGEEFSIFHTRTTQREDSLFG